MAQYFVEWTIDVEADSAEEAARKALAIQRDPTSIATVFSVFANGARATAQSIDLIEIDDQCGSCHRQMDDCSADPCPDVLADREA